MSFLNQFLHHPPSHPEYQGPPQPPAPWIAEYDNQSQRWYFVNTQTGQREWNFPQQGGYGGPSGGGYGGAPAPQTQSHAGRNTALAAVGGLAAGALLMHEGEKVEDHWKRDEEKFEYDKDRIENRVDYDEDRFDNRVEYDRDRFENRVAYDENRVANDFDNFPDNAARWTGEKVGEVEAIPQDIEYDYDRAKYDTERRFDDGVQRVEDIPDDLAGWAGDKVGDVERFDDGIEDAYDEGRDDARYGGDY